MPNLDSKYIVNLKSKKSLRQRVKKKVKQHSQSVIEFQCKLDYNSLVVDESLSWLELFIEEGKIRLDIVSFIVRKTKSIINNALIIAENLNFESLEHNGEDYLKERRFACQRDAEIILLYICNAILQKNSELLQNQYFEDLKATYGTLNIPIDQKIRIINVMKNSIMSFVNHRTSDLPEFNSELIKSEHNYYNLTLEIASYFDMVIDNLT